MIILDCEQGSSEWRMARLGIPTASQFHRVITAKTRKPSSSAVGYMYQLIAERLVGSPIDDASFGFMERGSQMELDAVSYYEFQIDQKTTKVGFCLMDDKRAGCSPDRLVGDDGGLEIKCPGAAQHVANLLGMRDKYFPQIQGCLWITGRQWWDLLSYHPSMPCARMRFQRDEEYIALLAEAVYKLINDVGEAEKKLQAMFTEATVGVGYERS